MNTAKRVSVVLLGLGLAACVTRGEIEEIKKNQEKILSKLDGMQRGAPAAQAPQRRAGPDPSKVYAFPFDGVSAKGPADAWITIVEVSDFECPFCKRVNPTLKEIQDKYGSDVRIGFAHNPLPFHKKAMPAAMASECAGDQGKFWQMHDELFENQRALDEPQLESYAQKIGVDMGKWKSCMSGEKHKAKIQQQQALAAKLGARGTPAFFINGRFLSGAQPFASFQNIIDEELKKAKDSGVAKKDYYAKQVIEKGEKAAL